MSASADLTFALYHAIAYLTRSLIGRYSATTIDLLHFTLERNLSKHFETTSCPGVPQRMSGRRCLTLSPHCAPPRPIYYACKSARISWEEWIMCLGNVEIDLFIDPGSVSVRFAGVNKTYIVWSAKSAIKGAQSPPAKKQPTIAQSIIDDDEDELFSMIADETRWLTPILSQFPAVPRPAVTISAPSQFVIPVEAEPESATSTTSTSSLLSVLSRHSRSSSRSSDTSSSGFSFSSVESAGTAATSNYASSCSGRRPAALRSSPNLKSASRSVLLPASTLIMQAPVSFDGEELEDAILMTPRYNRAPVHIDSSKKEVTPYDGGKTNVLTGGVMLGMKSSPAQAPTTPSTPRFAATPQAAGRKTIWRNPANVRVRC